MNTFIVRIYRNTDGKPREIIGVVEEPEVNGRKPFRDLKELWCILMHGSGDGCAGRYGDKETNKL